MYAFDIFLLLILASFDTHDMKPMYSMCKLLYIALDLSTLTTFFCP